MKLAHSYIVLLVMEVCEMNKNGGFRSSHTRTGAKVNSTLGRLKGILDRYEKYEAYLKYPGDWGERAFRGWVVLEIFHENLKWPIGNIVFGEKFDVLFVSNNVKPVIYLETKRPKRGLADLTSFAERIPNYNTLVYAVLANGYEWLRRDIVRKIDEQITLRGDHEKWRAFLQPLHAKNYLYGVCK